MAGYADNQRKGSREPSQLLPRTDKLSMYILYKGNTIPQINKTKYMLVRNYKKEGNYKVPTIAMIMIID